MKKFKTLMSLTLMLLFVCSILAQEKKTQAYVVHEDFVMLSKTMEYEKVAKELVSHLTKHNIQDESWLAASTNDNRYMFISPIKKMADLDRQLFTSLSEKMGKEALGELWGKMDKCYNKHIDYVVHLDNELSYMPDGMTVTPEGQDFREFHYLYHTPGNTTTVMKHMKKIKQMFADKGSKVHYRVYRSGFGTPGNFLMVAVAAENQLDMAQKGDANDKLLGEEGQKAFGALMSNLTKYKKYEGQMRPDLGYTPSQTVATKD
ncbi:MAG: hypothetical protein QNJ57_01490 [Flavobacteriaceae bacterium]|nr:hypothetical protein [Flavobacteriaceae bacterium]